MFQLQIYGVYLNHLIVLKKKGDRSLPLFINQLTYNYFTICNLITTGLQQHKKVKFAGYNVPHLLENNVKIHYELINDKVLIIDIINDVVKYYIDIYSNIIKKNKQIKLN